MRQSAHFALAKLWRYKLLPAWTSTGNKGKSGGYDRWWIKTGDSGIALIVFWHRRLWVRIRAVWVVWWYNCKPVEQIIQNLFSYKHFTSLYMSLLFIHAFIQFETENTPPAVASHCGCVVNNSLIIFGGSQNSRATNAVYVLDIESKLWHTPSFK